MNKNKTVVVDIIPEIESNDAKRIYDHGIIKLNQIVLSTFNQLNMQLSTMDDFQDLGCLEELLRLSFSESIAQISENISNNLTSGIGTGVNVSILKEGNNNNIANVIVTLENVPDFKFTADLIKRNQRIKIVNPEILGV